MRMKKLIFLWSLIFLYGTIFGWGQAKPISPANIQISEKNWDFGFTPADVFISHIARITNIGKDTLIIAKVKTGCGCTSAPLGKQILKPQESTDLEIILYTKGYHGAVEKSVTIYSTDAIEPIVDIFFTTLVDSQNSLVEISPSLVLFDSIVTNQNTEKQIMLKNITTQPLSIKVIEKPKEFISFEIPTNKINPQETVPLVIRVKKDAPARIFKTSLCLEFSGEKQIRYSLPINGKVIKR
jgi:hypothetical protein